MADDPRRHRRRIRAEEREVADVGLVRQQHVEHGRRDAEIQKSQRNLREADRRARNAQLPAAHLQRSSNEDAADRVSDDEAQQRGADDARPPEWQVHGRVQLLRLEQQRQATQRRKSNATREAAESLHRHDIDGREARRRIEPQANRGPGERGEPEVVAERVRDERREHHARIRHRLAQVAQAEQVVAAEDPVAERGDHQRRADVACGDAAQLAENIANVQVRDFAMEHVRHRAEYGERGDRADPAPDPRRLRLDGVLCGHGLRKRGRRMPVTA